MLDAGCPVGSVHLERNIQLRKGQEGRILGTNLAFWGIQAQSLCDEFGVAVRRQTDSALEHVSPQALAVGEFAVVGDRHGAVLRVHDERLTVHFLRAGRGRVSGVADAEIALQLSDRIVVEYVADHAHALVDVEVLCAVAFARDDARRLLAAVLQRDQPQADRLRDFNLKTERIIRKRVAGIVGFNSPVASATRRTPWRRRRRTRTSCPSRRGRDPRACSCSAAAPSRPPSEGLRSAPRRSRV